jgi:hypothetical protein
VCGKGAIVPRNLQASFRTLCTVFSTSNEEKAQLNTENTNYEFPEMKLQGLRGPVPNSYIHVFVSDLYIPRIGHWLQQNKLIDPGNI